MLPLAVLVASLETSSKLLESAISLRLLECVEAANGLFDYQYGFRRSRSTVDAINVVDDTAKRAIRTKDFNNNYCLIIKLDIILRTPLTPQTG